MTAESRRVLFISYHFPPSAAVGGQRIANFSRFLPSFGWEPHVLTIQDEEAEQLDPGRLRGLDDVRVHKVGVMPTPLTLWSAARRLRGKLAGPKREMVAPGRPPTGGEAGSGGESFLGRVKRYVLSLLVLPDLHNGWIPTASLRALLEVRRHRIDWVITSCPPYSVHVIGLAVKILTGRKWVADFRDPWMTGDPKALGPMSALSIGIESWLERKVVEKADLVLFNTDRMKEAYRERYAHVPKDRFAYIPNGVAEWKSPAAGDAGDKYDVFTLSYTGSLYVGRSPEPIFRAVAHLIQREKLTLKDLRIVLVGQCGLLEGVPMASVVERYGLESVVEVREPVPQAEAAQIIARSHLALLFAPRLKFQIPAKVYDYFAAGTRILAIADEGATADLIRQTDSGATFSTEETESIAEFIRKEMTARRSTDGRPAAALLRFDARRITEELASCLDQVGAR